METPIFYLRDNITVLDDYERQQLKAIPLPNMQTLDDVFNRVKASKHHYDLDTLLHTYQIYILLEKRTHWKIIPFVVFSSTAILAIFVYIVYTRFQNTYFITQKADATTFTSTSCNEPSTIRCENAEPSVLFASYTLQSTNCSNFRCPQRARQDERRHPKCLLRNSQHWQYQQDTLCTSLQQIKQSCT